MSPQLGIVRTVPVRKFSAYSATPTRHDLRLLLGAFNWGKSLAVGERCRSASMERSSTEDK